MVQFFGAEREFGSLFGLHAYLHRTLLDRRSGARGTLVVHGGQYRFFTVLTLFEVDDLRILSAQFDNGADIGMEMLYRKHNGIDLLHKTCVECRRDAACAGTCNVHLGNVVIRVFMGL